MVSSHSNLSVTEGFPERGTFGANTRTALGKLRWLVTQGQHVENFILRKENKPTKNQEPWYQH